MSACDAPVAQTCVRNSPLDSLRLGRTKNYEFIGIMKEMGSIISGNRMNEEEMEVVMNKTKEIVAVFRSSYALKVKQLLSRFKVLELDEMSDGGEIQSAYLSGQGRALFQMCSSKENIAVDVIVRNKKLYELSEHFMEIDRSLEELTESLGVCVLLYLQE
ncbi:LOW QUALITY PROTEIN: hypothetical protein YC2023_067610 [Brassica napus]